MNIHIYVIDKKGKKRLYEPLIEHYVTSCKRFAKVEVHEIFDREIARAHESSPSVARASYTRALGRYLGSGYDIALDPAASQVDSHGFAELLKDRPRVNLYIGGAHGFEEEFLRQCDRTLSLGKITLSHKLVKVVVLEQIFRGLSIVHNHPYHK